MSSTKKFPRETEAFIKAFVKDLSENNVAIFAGAGLSAGSGYVNWKELLQDIATELGLEISKEDDLISLAQYHVNETGNKATINRKIIEEFSHEAEETENHRILARLPIGTYWTTNYDELIENTLKKANKIPDVKHNSRQLANTKPKRDAVIYKMHGDVHSAADATITKQEYQLYYRSHEPFITALNGDLVSKTFLFIGFSFTDPNLDYVLGRLNSQFGKEDGKQHYCFIRSVTKTAGESEESFSYRERKLALMINDLKRYRIRAVLVDDYPMITEILREIEVRYRRNTVFISGSAENYGDWDKNDAHIFIHNLSKGLVKAGYRIVNGFGWGVGSAVINGALEAIYEQPSKFSEDQLIMKPFPQFPTGGKDIKELWHDYRSRMIPWAGIAVFIFGNKLKDGKIVEADGVHKEFMIALNNGLLPIPIGITGDMAKQIHDEILKEPGKYHEFLPSVEPLLQQLGDPETTPDKAIDIVVNIINSFNK